MYPSWRGFFSFDSSPPPLLNCLNGNFILRFYMYFQHSPSSKLLLQRLAARIDVAYQSTYELALKDITDLKLFSENLILPKAVACSVYPVIQISNH